jgi:hypothetical protein
MSLAILLDKENSYYRKAKTEYVISISTIPTQMIGHTAAVSK